ncbi:PREDICTED: sperm acrosome-associated protein 7 isoform X3 [Rhinopithecus bieti]|uniref:sperm acrosome-associated protein 7 isoform X3 n=1 Tax=Rhinopithecus bieti TaxID=61621 RepID=UPI00083C79EB|nr:PREDICTED: sperm acrosome-associated protein 7 isoform X3 [Rhinopithecus bieti]
MAVSQGEGTLCFVLLLCCWQETELRPRTATPGRAPQGWLSRKRTEPGSTTEIPFSSKHEDASELLEASANANLHGDPSENYSGPQVSPGSEKRVSSKEKTNSKNTQYENLSFLDKILQNIGRSSGNIFRNEQQRTSAQRRSRDSQ